MACNIDLLQTDPSSLIFEFHSHSMFQRQTRQFLTLVNFYDSKSSHVKPKSFSVVLNRFLGARHVNSVQEGS